MIARRNSSTFSSTKIVELLNNNCDPDSRNNNGYTVLILTCRYSSTDRNTETVKLLLHTDCNPDLRNNNGWSTLMMASNIYKKITIQKQLNYYWMLSVDECPEAINR